MIDFEGGGPGSKFFMKDSSLISHRLRHADTYLHAENGMGYTAVCFAEFLTSDTAYLVPELIGNLPFTPVQ